MYANYFSGWVQDYIRKIASTYSTSVHQYNRIGTGQYKLDYTVHTAEYTTKRITDTNNLLD